MAHRSPTITITPKAGAAAAAAAGGGGGVVIAPTNGAGGYGGGGGGGMRGVAVPPSVLGEVESPTMQRNYAGATDTISGNRGPVIRPYRSAEHTEGSGPVKQSQPTISAGRKPAQQSTSPIDTSVFGGFDDEDIFGLRRNGPTGAKPSIQVPAGTGARSSFSAAGPSTLSTAAPASTSVSPAATALPSAGMGLTPLVPVPPASAPVSGTATPVAGVTTGPSIAELMRHPVVQEFLFDLQLSDDEAETKAPAAGTDASIDEIAKQQQVRVNKARLNKLPMPRWRINDPNPDPSTIMSRKSVFRSGYIAVRALNLMMKAVADKRKAAEQEDRMDMYSMVKVYFEITKFWLAQKVARPIASVMNGSLRLKFSHENRSWLQRLRRNVDDDQVAMRLKVRIKGIMDALLATAMDPNGVPMPILLFLRRMTTDGAYFPPDYLFECETKQLQFSALGATRHMRPFEVKEGAAPSKPRNEDEDDPMLSEAEAREAAILAGRRIEGSTAACEVVIGVFLVARVLIGLVVLHPVECGIASTGRRGYSSNLRLIATVLWHMLFRIYTPTNLSDSTPAGVKGARRLAQRALAGALAQRALVSSQPAAPKEFFLTEKELAALVWPASHLTPVSELIDEWMEVEQARLKLWIRLMTLRVLVTIPEGTAQ